MPAKNATLEQVLHLAKRLTPEEKVQLIKNISPGLEASSTHHPTPKPFKSLYGIFSDLGKAPSEEAFKEARREAFKNFPREFSE